MDLLPYGSMRLLSTITNNTKINSLSLFCLLGCMYKIPSSAVLKVQSMVDRVPEILSGDSQTIFIILRHYLSFHFHVYNGIVYIFKKIILFSKTNKISEKSSI